jgi:hypothetical protein
MEEGLLLFGFFAFAFWGFTLSLFVWEAFGREKNCKREKLLKGKR